MERRLPVLLPVERKGPAQDNAQADKADQLCDSRPFRKRRPPVKVACDRCRWKRIQCNGQLPVCSNCNKKNISCEYDQTGVMAVRGKVEELRKELKAKTDLLDRLRSVPEKEALSVLRQLRGTTDVNETASSMGRPSPCRELSNHRCARGTLLSTQFSVEYELTMLHNFVYPALEPLDPPDIDLEYIVRNSATKSVHLVPGESSVKYNDSEDVNTINPSILNANTRAPLVELSSKELTLVAGPLPPLQCCDSRLTQFNVDFWTRVPISNDLAAAAISTYLETDHALLGFFDVDLFLSDLVEQHFDYCSPFLVSSLLCQACLCYTGIDRRASALSHAFQHEAEQLWPAYRGSDTITTLSAVLLLAIACTWLGKDKLGQDLLTDSRAMAERLELFGSPRTDVVQACSREMTQERIRATSHVAWGCYGYVTFHATMYGGKPVAYPPILPLPGERNRRTASDSQWPPHPLPSYMGGTFTAICELWSIVQEVLAMYNIPRDGALADKLPLSFAEQKYQKLLSWADTLTHELARNNRSPLHVHIFHTMYHVTVLNIFRPFLPTSGISRLRSFASSNSSPITILTASFQQLKRLLVEAIKRPSYKAQSGLLNPAVMHISNIILAHSDRQNWHKYFFLCMNFWVDAIPSFPVLADIAQVNVSLALFNGNLSTDEARKVKQTLAEVSGQYRVDKVSSSVIVDFDRAVTQGDTYRAYEIAEKSQDYALFDEYTTGNASQDSVSRQD